MILLYSPCKYKKPDDDIQYLYKILHITTLLFRNNNKTRSKKLQVSVHKRNMLL